MGNQKETQKNPQYKYASTREKLCFGIGAIGKDAICNLVGAFLMLYFTDTLYLAPAFVGVLFFVARIWDAINDPMMGMIVDNTHTRFGKFRIWLVIGTLVNSVVFVLLFHSFNLSGTALYVYVSVMYILYGMTYTIMDVPYWSWLPNLTNDPHEREKVSIIPRFFASLAGFSVATFGLYIVNYLNKTAGESNLYAENGYTIEQVANELPHLANQLGAFIEIENIEIKYFDDELKPRYDLNDFEDISKQNYPSSGFNQTGITKEKFLKLYPQVSDPNLDKVLLAAEYEPKNDTDTTIPYWFAVNAKRMLVDGDSFANTFDD